RPLRRPRHSQRRREGCAQEIRRTGRVVRQDGPLSDAMKKLLACLLLSATPAFAQDMDHMNMPGMNMPGMDMSGHDMAAMDMRHGMHGLFGTYGMSREASGTSWQPEAAPHDAIHLQDTGDWMVMLHAKMLGVADSQSGPRGDSMVFSSGMLMAMASTDAASGGTLGLKAMLSLDPLMGR